mmetsp:Transcript_38025/g.61609  ORF Transcript_38025/g.61609 Transcript_38025/m.61609 type:complete len:106 (+) Transcript_38025:409-726(+)
MEGHQEQPGDRCEDRDDMISQGRSQEIEGRSKQPWDECKGGDNTKSLGRYKESEAHLEQPRNWCCEDGVFNDDESGQVQGERGQVGEQCEGIEDSDWVTIGAVQG